MRKCTYCFLILLVFMYASAFAATSAFIGTIQPIPISVQEKMHGNSWQPNCPVPLSQLSYLTLSYWGFDNQAHQGVLIVNKAVAQNVVKIFQQLFLQHFPIASMQPMYVFNNNDEKSMAANNTAAFACRPMLGNSGKFSLHAYGMAIDINPLLNPYVGHNTIRPNNGKIYANRALNLPGMITINSIAYKVFTSYGWHWGGNWRFVKDYQHFQK